jgi:DNA-binding MarR family transcriptional regulator
MASFPFEQYGSAFLAKWLHTVRVEISAQCDEIFIEQGIDIPSHCVSVLLLLKGKKRIGLTEIADELGYSHQLINQRLKLLKNLELIERLPDATDKRKNLVKLTKRGKEQAAKFDQALRLVSAAIDHCLKEVGIDLFKDLETVQGALTRKRLLARVSDE